MNLSSEINKLKQDLMIDENLMIRKLGDGASANVYETVDNKTGKRYAVKVFLVEEGNKKYENHFFRESSIHS